MELFNCWLARWFWLTVTENGAACGQSKFERSKRAFINASNMAGFSMKAWNESAKIKFFNLSRHNENFHFYSNCWIPKLWNFPDGLKNPIEIIFEPWNESPKMKFRVYLKIGMKIWQFLFFGLPTLYIEKHQWLKIWSVISNKNHQKFQINKWIYFEMNLQKWNFVRIQTIWLHRFSIFLRQTVNPR